MPIQLKTHSSRVTLNVFLAKLASDLGALKLEGEGITKNNCTERSFVPFYMVSVLLVNRNIGSI